MHEEQKKRIKNVENAGSDEEILRAVAGPMLHMLVDAKAVDGNEGVLSKRASILKVMKKGGPEDLAEWVKVVRNSVKGEEFRTERLMGNEPYEEMLLAAVAAGREVRIAKLVPVIKMIHEFRTVLTADHSAYELCGGRFLVKKGSTILIDLTDNKMISASVPENPLTAELTQTLQDKYKATGYTTVTTPSGRALCFPEDVLGHGGFGTVFALKKLAVKVQNKTLASEREVEVIRLLMESTKHSNIVTFDDVFEVSGVVVIVMERCAGKSLYKLQAERLQAVDAKRSAEPELQSPFKPHEVLHVVGTVLDVLVFLKERNILHRDISPVNIIAMSSVNGGSDISRVVFKVIDFGVSLIVRGEHDLAHTAAGNPMFVAPEVLGHDGYSFQVDIFSLGKVARSLTTHYDAQPPPEPLSSFIMSMMHPDPAQRPSLTALVEQHKALSAQHPRPMLGGFFSHGIKLWS